MSTRRHVKISKQQQTILKEFRKVELLLARTLRPAWKRPWNLPSAYHRYQNLVSDLEKAIVERADHRACVAAHLAGNHAQGMLDQMLGLGWRKPKTSLLDELSNKLKHLQSLTTTYELGVLECLRHEAIAGQKGTEESVFDPAHFLQQQAELTLREVTFEQYRANPQWHGISPHPLLDAEWYQKTYLGNSTVSPLEHFMNEGWAVGHKPYAHFDEMTFFKEVRRQMAARGINPLVLFNSDSSFRLQYADERATYADWILESTRLNPVPNHPAQEPKFKVHFIGLDMDAAGPMPSVLANQNPECWEYGNRTKLADEDYWVLISPQVQLGDQAFEVLKHALRLHPTAQLLYADEDHLKEGERSNPYFKPDFLLENLRAQAYLGGILLVRGEALRKCGYLGWPKNELDLWEYTLHLGHHYKASQLVHVPRILSHRRCPSLSLRHGEVEVIEMIQRYLLAFDLAAQIGVSSSGVSYVAYDLPSKPPRVSVIIPTKNKLDYLERCVRSLEAQTRYPDYEILIVDNGSDEPECLSWLAQIASTSPRVKMLHYSHPFNYSAINNFAAAQATGEVLILLNNDTEIIHGDWMSQMVSLASRSEVGCVGALLYFPNDTIQHAGVIMGLGGVANHALLHQPRGSEGYHGSLTQVQEVDAVTAACLAVRKAVFEQVGGLDEKNLSIAFNDVDFCLRVGEAGYRNLITPFAQLYHHESVSRGAEDTPEKYARFKAEVLHMQDRWQDRLHSTRCYNPNLSEVATKTFRWSWPPRQLPAQWRA